MKRLTEYISNSEADKLMEELLSIDYSQYETINEGILGDIMGKIKGAFSGAKNVIKAGASVLTDKVKKNFEESEWGKKYLELQQEEDETKRIAATNDAIKEIDNDKDLDDSQKAMAKMDILNTAVKMGESAKQNKAVEEAKKQLQELVKKYSDVAKKLQDALKKNGANEEGGEGNPEDQPAQKPEEIIKQNSGDLKGVQQATGGDANVVNNALKVFFGISEHYLVNHHLDAINESATTKELKTLFSAKNDPKGEKLTALTGLLMAWQGLAKQLGKEKNVEAVLPLFQAICADKNMLAALNGGEVKVDAPAE